MHRGRRSYGRQFPLTSGPASGKTWIMMKDSQIWSPGSPRPRWPLLSIRKFKFYRYYQYHFRTSDNTDLFSSSPASLVAVHCVPQPFIEAEVDSRTQSYQMLSHSEIQSKHSLSSWLMTDNFVQNEHLLPEYWWERAALFSLPFRFQHRIYDK